MLAGASSTGYTVVWDLRGKREVVALVYGGGAGTLGGAVGSAMAVGGRRGMSVITWHPDNVHFLFVWMSKLELKVLWLGNATGDCIRGRHFACHYGLGFA